MSISGLGFPRVSMQVVDSELISPPPGEHVDRLCDGVPPGEHAGLRDGLPGRYADYFLAGVRPREYAGLRVGVPSGGYADCPRFR